MNVSAFLSITNKSRCNGRAKSKISEMSLSSIPVRCKCKCILPCKASHQRHRQMSKVMQPSLEELLCEEVPNDVPDSSLLKRSKSRSTILTILSCPGTGNVNLPYPMFFLNANCPHHRSSSQSHRMRNSREPYSHAQSNGQSNCTDVRTLKLPWLHGLTDCLCRPQTCLVLDRHG